MRVTLDNGWVNLPDGRRVPVWAGEFHYFRNERKYWPRILKNMKDAGLTVATSFVQPNYHEYAPGKFDFEGRTAPERDLPHLLELAKEIGIWIHLRLGPACCEWRESGGSSFGTPWRDISNAFWDAVAPYQADRGGSLLLYQVHNEWVHPLGIYYIILPAISGFDGFTAPAVQQWLELIGPNPHYTASGYSFSMNYLPEYLASLYPDISSMNSAWQSDYTSFDAVKDEFAAAGVSTLHGYILRCKEILRDLSYPGASPRKALDLLNWANFYKAAPLAKEVEHTRERTSLPVLHNWAMGDEREWCKMTGLDLCGYDVYAPISVDIWAWSKYTYDMQTSPFPFSNEFMCGTIERYEWGGQGFYTDNIARMLTLSYLMGGMKGVNLYMFVERDNWLQCPLDERGGKRLVYYAISSLVRALLRNNWHEAKMTRDLGVLKCTDYHRYADGSDDGMFDEGYREDYIRDGLYAGHAPKQQYVASFRALHDASVDFAVFKETREGESIRDFKVILAYSLWFMRRDIAVDLLRWVEKGGHLVLFPCIPTHADDGCKLDVFTGELGLKPFTDSQTADSHIAPGEVDISAVLDGSPGDFATADGRLWAQARNFGRGKVLALNVQVADDPVILEAIVTRWGGCRKFVNTGLALTDGSIHICKDGCGVLAAVNGSFDETVREIRIDISALPEAQVYAVTDELSETLIGNIVPRDGFLHVPVELGPRDGALLKVSPGSRDIEQLEKPEPQPIAIDHWYSRREDEEVYRQRYLGADIDESWTPVCLEDWTLPAIASGKVLGVQGWFYLKQNIELPQADGPVYLHLRPKGYHNLGIVYLNGAECGRFAIERPGAEMMLDVTEHAVPGENTLAVRLYRQSLDCHDRGSSGFDLIRFECGGNVVNVEQLYLRQERRDYGEMEGWAGASFADEGWTPCDLPMELTMDRAGDALWLRADVDIDNPGNAVLRVEGDNCVVCVFVNGEYVVKSPMLPCDLSLDGFLKPGANKLALRITPDNFEHYTLPQSKRYESYIRDGFLPLRVKVEKAEVLQD